MFNSLFLDDVAGNKNERQQLDHLLTITAPHERVILAGIGAILLALAAWALFGAVARDVTVTGVLLKPGERHEIVSTEPGRLVRFLVAPGDVVEQGGALARQTVPELEREVAALRDQVDMLETRARRVDGDDAHSALAAAREALFRMEARRGARETIVSHFSGEVMALSAAPGDYLPAGSVVARIREREADESLQVALLVDSRVARRLQAGMPARVEVVTAGGETREVEGEVESMISDPPPRWLSEFLSADEGLAHRVNIALRPDSNGLDAPDGAPCRARVAFDQHPLVAFFDPERL